MRRSFKTWLVVLVGALGIAYVCYRFCLRPTPSPVVSAVTPVYTYKIVHSYPHDPAAFTQGLAFEKGVLYEGTGLKEQSTLRVVDLETGRVLRMHSLPDRFFGEGITVCGDKIIQLTYTSRVGFVYDKNTFEMLREFTYAGEGWGITYDGTRLIMSDGTSKLHVLDPETLEEAGDIEVHVEQIPVTGLNELEYVRGEILANVRPTQRIARISPSTGEVTGWIDLAWLKGSLDPGGECGILNGIAYDAQNDRLFVTGKLWPRIFEIRLVPLE